MGLDYSIDLYFRVEDIEKALNALVRIAWTSPNEKTTVILPDGKEILMPFTSHLKSGNRLAIKTEKHFQLDTVLLFVADEPLLAYLNFNNHDYRVFKEEIVYHRLGMIYLYMTYGVHFTQFSFRAATSGMSKVFLNSTSVQQRFLELLKNANGYLH